MTESDSKPTPALGMPAASAATLPSITAQPMSTSSVTNDKLLTTIEEVRDEARERAQKDGLRFERIESRLDDVVSETRTNTKNISEQASSLTRIAHGAAQAVDIALQAKREAAGASDEVMKIVQSALAMHGTSIAASVDQAVTRAVTPLVTKVDSLEKSKEDTATTLATQNGSLDDLKRSNDATTTTLKAQDATLKEHGETFKVIDGKVDEVKRDVTSVVTNVGTIASGVAKLVRWQDQWWVKVLLGVAAVIGALYAAYRGGMKNEPQQPSTQTVIVSPNPPPSLTSPAASY